MDGRSYVGELVTLDGRPALVTGRRLPFAMVQRMDGSGGVEFAWSTVANVIEHRGGRFGSKAGQYRRKPARYHRHPSHPYLHPAKRRHRGR
jgi:hypothetical protein